MYRLCTINFPWNFLIIIFLCICLDCYHSVPYQFFVYDLNLVLVWLLRAYGMPMFHYQLSATRKGSSLVSRRFDLQLCRGLMRVYLVSRPPRLSPYPASNQPSPAYKGNITTRFPLSEINPKDVLRRLTPTDHDRRGQCVLVWIYFVSSGSSKACHAYMGCFVWDALLAQMHDGGNVEKTSFFTPRPSNPQEKCVCINPCTMYPCRSL
jgi:hypothetical protein